MSWLEISVRVPRQNAALVENLLRDERVLALTLTDDADDPVLEPGVGETPLWPSVCVTALFAGDTDAIRIAKILSLLPGIERTQQVSFRRFEDQHWERIGRDQMQTMRFGQNLWIVPGHQTPAPDARHVIRLDPGLAFGTGTHPTTQLCLQWIDGHDFEGLRVVDYGCGSGVLGIAAAIKGAAEVICVDNDPQALTATRENAERNNVARQLRILTPDKFDRKPAYIVMANILAGALVDLMPELLAMLTPGGQLVLSGILEGQANDVVSAYDSHIENMQELSLDGWVLLTGKKPIPVVGHEA